jgi:transposase
MSPRKKSTQHTREFQQNAVRLASMPGRSIAAVALELKIPAWKLRNWVRESKDQVEKGEDLQELNRLTNEVKRLREENEILKKAAAYFAKELR